MGCRNNSRVHKEYMQVAMQKVMYLRHTRLLYIANRICTWVFLKESRVHTKNSFLGYFCAFSDFGVFWKVLAD